MRTPRTSSRSSVPRLELSLLLLSFRFVFVSFAFDFSELTESSLNRLDVALEEADDLS